MQELRKIQDDDLFLASDDDEDTQSNKFLSFKIGDESYGIEIKSIIEIVEVQRIIEVPDMPVYIKGVVNLRGKVIPVMDLRLRFNMQERKYDDRTCIIIVNVNNTAVGLIVDNVDEVLEIPENSIEPPPNFKTRSGSNKFINGLGKISEEVKILLDVQKILYDEDFQKISNI
ncbi:MAG: chemotaxis protein CheW [Spirochaetes bacterium GWD1_27_9]|nr:MAG: chemotaxis protein CheW [Spirochaetes bacterium GWB1_27_13]OHD35537.1 MAG: chemotaxis protein CheW [Spirochaetes bacterium GWD1_27_9]